MSADNLRTAHSKLKIRGFSLIEVVLALGIASFSLLLLTALIPTGLQTNKESVEESQAINLLSGMIAERMSVPLNKKCPTYPELPILETAMQDPESGFFYVDEAGQSLAADPGGARYRVEYSIRPSALNSQAPYQGHFRVIWPALGTTTTGSVETMAAFSQP
jgi:uncharacterized protein (TIGR02598 family)